MIHRAAVKELITNTIFSVIDIGLLVVGYQFSVISCRLSELYVNGVNMQDFLDQALGNLYQKSF